MVPDPHRHPDTVPSERKHSSDLRKGTLSPLRPECRVGAEWWGHGRLKVRWESEREGVALGRCDECRTEMTGSVRRTSER